MNTSLFVDTCGFGMELVAALFPITAPSKHSQRMSDQLTILKNFQQIYVAAFLNSFFSLESRCDHVRFYSYSFLIEECESLPGNIINLSLHYLRVIYGLWVTLLIQFCNTRCGILLIS
jgi:hypothetical protein